MYSILYKKLHCLCLNYTGWKISKSCTCHVLTERPLGFVRCIDEIQRSFPQLKSKGSLLEVFLILFLQHFKTQNCLLPSDNLSVNRNWVNISRVIFFDSNKMSYSITRAIKANIAVILCNVLVILPGWIFSSLISMKYIVARLYKTAPHVKRYISSSTAKQDLIRTVYEQFTKPWHIFGIGLYRFCCVWLLCYQASLVKKRLGLSGDMENQRNNRNRHYHQLKRIPSFIRVS